MRTWLVLNSICGLYTLFWLGGKQTAVITFQIEAFLTAQARGLWGLYISHLIKDQFAWSSWTRKRKMKLALITASCVLGTAVRTLPNWVPTTTLQARYNYYIHLTEEETKAQRVKERGPGRPSLQWGVESGFKSMSVWLWGPCFFTTRLCGFLVHLQMEWSPRALCWSKEQLRWLSEVITVCPFSQPKSQFVYSQ